MVIQTMLVWGALLVLGGTQEVPDGCIKVRMREQAVCEDKEVKECGVCHTVHMRDCTITMKKVLIPHMYKRCHVNKRQSRMCVEGVRRVCEVR